MIRAWFIPWGWVHRPRSWQGALLVLLAVVFCVQVFIAVDRHSHSASDTLYGVFPYIVPCLMLLEWVAARTSGPVPISDERLRKATETSKHEEA
jgi:hypothetical protein